MRFLFAFGMCVALLACQSNTKKTELPAEVDYLKSKDVSVVLSQGYNRGAVFSVDGEKIYYISKNRIGHKNTQIHEYDLTMQRDRRLTFQDGEILSVFPLEKNQILYSSTTDEIKEQPFATDANPAYPRAEVYHSDLYGNEIGRLTNSPGFDGEMIFVPMKRQMLFTSTRSGVPGLYWLDLDTDQVLPFQVDPAKPQRNPSLSADGKNLYWIEEDATAKVQNIVTTNVWGKNRKIVKSLQGVVKDVAFSRKGELVYSWIPEGSEFSQIDLYEAEKLCTQTILKNKLNFSEVRFSVKNPNLMIFRVTSNDKSQVYRWDLPMDLGPCNEQPVSDTLKK
ncbi:TolB family protein [Bdellovibrio sp. HCB337]|uniref:TolB family protein n=1 Tax=Bdellovibrio sp. HCB337 TaxID=3394358 RepID=UPI0039A4B932